MAKSALVMTFDVSGGGLQELMAAAGGYRSNVEAMGGRVTAWWSVVAGKDTGSMIISAEHESASKVGEMLDQASATGGGPFRAARQAGAVLVSRSIFTEAELL